MTTGYSQNDPAWKGQILGGGPDTIGNDGCYLTSFATIATWMGRAVNPAQLNSAFKSAGIFGDGCAECLPDNALERAFPSLSKLVNVWNYQGVPADLSKLSNAAAPVFKCVEISVGSGTHFMPVVDGTKGSASTVYDPWPYPAYVRPISDYGDPATIILKITEHDFTPPTPVPPAPNPEAPFGYWPGWDIARGLVMANATDGVKLDGWGGLHALGNFPGPIQSTGYWAGWDIARDLALNPDGLTGYVLDGWGGLHPFAAASSTLPPTPKGYAYWPGWDIAKRLVVTSQGAGAVLDGWGGRHPFSS